MIMFCLWSTTLVQEHIFTHKYHSMKISGRYLSILGRKNNLPNKILEFKINMY